GTREPSPNRQQLLSSASCALSQWYTCLGTSPAFLLASTPHKDRRLHDPFGSAPVRILKPTIDSNENSRPIISYMTALEAWESFYVIVGSSAGALIGLQFVVITLISELPVAPNAAMASRAFSTPGIIHFIAVLFLSAVISAPWE